MNIQVERQENHTARMTVELDVERFAAAKQQAARKLSNRLNIPGFRKGKAPYRIVLNYVGEGAINEEAVDLLGEQIYKEALPQTQVEPYGPGALEDVKFDGTPTFVYTLPLQPEVDLGTYRELRADYVVPPVEDEAVDRNMRVQQEQNAVIEDSTQPAALGNRITMDIHSFFLETHEEESDAEEGEEHEHDEHEHHHEHGEHFINEQDFVTLLNEDYEPVAGFNAEIAGMNVGDKKEFELVFPEDAKDEELRGRKVKFEVTIKKIESFTMPELTDDFAARVTASEEKPLTLLELRVRTRQNLIETGERRYKSQYANEALDKIVQGATIKYPEEVVQDEVERSLQRFDQQLRQQSRMTLQDYLKIARTDVNALYQQFRPSAVKTVERALVLRELLRAEGVQVSDERVTEEIDKIIGTYDEATRDQIRNLFNSPDMRESVLDDLLTNAVMDRVVAIAKGEAPELPAPAEAAATDAPAETTNE
ncbi:MAG: trigger factor [Anaerolineae bacterium]